MAESTAAIRTDPIPGFHLGHLVDHRPGVAVYSATRRSDGLPVNLHVVSEALASSRTFSRTLNRRLATLRQPGTPHLAGVLDTGEADTGMWFAMQPPEGRTLSDRLGYGPLELDEAARLVSHVAAGLDALHSRKLVHGRLTPERIWIGDDGRAVVHGAERPLRRLTREALLSAGDELDFMSSEIIRGRPPEARSDVYALAAIAYRAVTGALPHDHDWEAAILYPDAWTEAVLDLRASKPPVPVSRRRPGLPAALDPVLAHGLANEAKRRPAQASAFARDCRAAMRLFSDAGDEASPVVPVQPRGEAPTAPRARDRERERVERDAPVPAPAPVTPPTAASAPPPAPAPAPAPSARRPPEPGEGDDRAAARRAAARAPQRGVAATGPAPAQSAAAAAARPAPTAPGESPDWLVNRLGPYIGPTPRTGDAAASAPYPVAPSDSTLWRRVAVAAIVVLTAGLAGAGIGGTGEEPSSEAPARPAARTPATVENARFAFRVPPGWDRLKETPDLAGVTLKRVLAVGPRGNGNPALVAGMAAAPASGLLAPELRALADGQSGEPVRIGNAQAYRYSDLALPDGRDATVYVVPTTTGVATIACLADGSAAEERLSRCASAAGTLKLDARDYRVGADPAYAKRVNGVIDRLNSRRADVRRALGQASTRSSQASEAGRLAQIYRDAAGALSRQQRSPEIAALHASTVDALRDARAQYRRMAAAARGGSPRRYAAARRGAGRAEARLDRRLEAFRRAGYRLS